MSRPTVSGGGGGHSSSKNLGFAQPPEKPTILYSLEYYYSIILLSP
jgi:hypothetical protein